MSGGEQLTAKYDNDADAYIICPASDALYRRTGGWRHQPMTLSPGAYRVNLRLKASRGYEATVVLRVVNPGRGTILSHEVLSPRLITRVQGRA